MWNKQKDEPTYRPQPEPIRGSSTPQPANTPAPPQTPPQSMSKSRAASAIIGASMHIKGEIRTHEELVVDGEVEGVLESMSLLTVGQNGKVRANIKAREVIVFGSVRGDVEVTEKISIREQGSLIGNIKSAGISIDDGAYFKGSIDIVRPEPKITNKVVRSEPEVKAQAG